MRRIRGMGRRGTLVLARADLNDAVVLRTLASARPDVLVSFFFPKKIPKSVLELAPRGAFGAHPSLLPAYRGPDPYFWAIRNGDAETGVTLHRLDERYDTGAIVDVRRCAITPRHTAWTLARALDRPALDLLVQAMRRLEAGERLEGVPQPSEGVSHAPSPSDADTTIDWYDDAAAIARLVRACAPFPGAAAELDGTHVEVVRARVCEEAAPRALDVAEAFRTRTGEIAVRCGEGALVLEQVRGEDGEAVDPSALLGLSAQA